ncbi:MAG: polysaccharide pyruvyl transferase family protein [Acidimicrobiales bacterium]
MSEAIFCSFYSDDDYYRNHGIELKQNLDSLGLDFFIEEIEKGTNENWIDICRRKVPFLHKVCQSNPDKRVFWIDVDCRLLGVPEFILESTADIIGFQRGFSSTTKIGYNMRSRFWEPCFWGVGTSPSARKMINDAHQLESTLDVLATDDYFFEEGWRSNADNLTFQLIPSACVVGKYTSQTVHPAFFAFGASGNVEEFKGEAAQHQKNILEGPMGFKQIVIASAKLILAKLPRKISQALISISDKSGLTGLILGSENQINDERLANPENVPAGTALPSATKEQPGVNIQQRRKVTSWIVANGIKGDEEKMESLIQSLSSDCMLNDQEQNAISAARTFSRYVNRDSEKEIALSWWVRPFPGNFGDWLSPLIFSHYSQAKIKFVPPTGSVKSSPKHIVGVGSIGRFINKRSLVVGTGISSHEHPLDKRARYFSVRGPLTASYLKDCGGPVVNSFGDPAAIISRIFPFRHGDTNGRVALVRHFSHERVPLKLPENFDELSVLMSSPQAIEEFISKLVCYDEVVTSAMHVMIVCHAFGIPCSLVTFEGLEHAVHGSGIKYTDYALGVGLPEMSPVVISRDLTEVSFRDIRKIVSITEEKKDEIESVIKESLDFF